MNEAARVDARGLSCPQPVMLTRQAMRQENASMIEVTVDSPASADNIRRAAEKAGWAVNVSELEHGDLRLELTK